MVNATKQLILFLALWLTAGATHLVKANGVTFRASAPSAVVMDSRALALYSMSWTGLRKAITLSPAANRAVPPVGRTWLEPAR